MWMWTRESFPKVVLHKVRWWSQWTCFWIQQGHWIRCWDHRYLCSRLHRLLCYWPKEERKGLPCSCMCSVYTIPLQSSINYPNELKFSTINRSQIKINWYWSCAYRCWHHFPSDLLSSWFTWPLSQSPELVSTQLGALELLWYTTKTRHGMTMYVPLNCPLTFLLVSFTSMLM